MTERTPSEARTLSSRFAQVRYPDPRLLEHHRPLLELYHQGLTYKQIARALGRFPHGVRYSVRQLRRKGIIQDFRWKKRDGA
jgi:DNA-binding NarL/FixJ family response regulator